MFEQYEEVEFLLDGKWTCGSIVGHLNFGLKCEYNSYIVECYGQEYMIDENNIRKLAK